MTGASAQHTGPHRMLDATLPEPHLVPFQTRNNDTSLGFAALPSSLATFFASLRERETDRQKPVSLTVGKWSCIQLEGR